MTVLQMETKVREVFTVREKAEIGTPTLIETFSIHFFSFASRAFVSSSMYKHLPHPVWIVSTDLSHLAWLATARPRPRM